MCKNTMKVVVIDGAISIGYKDLVAEYYTLVDQKMVNCDAYVEHLSHATICDLIIMQYAHGAELININILGYDDVCDIQKLASALEWCLSRNIDVINISAGIINFVDNSEEVMSLLELCNKLNSKGVKIVSAQDNDGFATIPAKFKSVVSVETSNILLAANNEFRSSDYVVKGSAFIFVNGIVKKMEKCNSFSCAIVSAMFAEGKAHTKILRNKNITVFRTDCLAYWLCNVVTKALKRFFYIEKKNEDFDCPVICVNKNVADKIVPLLKNQFQKMGYIVSTIVDYSVSLTNNAFTIKRSRDVKYCSKFMKTDLIIYIVCNRVYIDCIYIERDGDCKLYWNEFSCSVNEKTIFKKLEELMIND